MSSFNERFMPVFNRVCVFLGDGWKIDKRGGPDSYRIILMNPAYKNYSIVTRQEKDRIILIGSVSRSQRSNGYSKCTVSLQRSPWGIANDIKKKILSDASQQIAFAEIDKKGAAKRREERGLMIGLLSRIVETRNYDGYYGVLCCVKTHSGVEGDVIEGHGDTYTLKLSGLSKDQLLKTVGFLSTVER